MAYFGLYALQHRGQESTGIASYDGKHIRLHAGMGLVPDVYDEATLGQELQGNRAIGHVRYSTSGVSVRKNAQPLVVRVCGIEIALAHNGNLTNASELRGELESEGAIFQTSSDSEIFVHLIARSLAKKKDLEEAILSACDRVRGAYSLIILSEGRIIALRDAHGFHPLAMGKVDDAYVFASETCAFDLLEAEYLREVLPGEMVVVDGDKVVSRPLNNAGKVPVRQCIFELVYFARPDSIVFGEDVYQCRKHMGYEMAKPDGAFYLFIKAPGGDANAFSDAAKKKDLLVVPGDGFGCPGYFRICYCVSLEMIQKSLPVFEELIRCGEW